jgi:hypothetical protein
MLKNKGKVPSDVSGYLLNEYEKIEGAAKKEILKEENKLKNQAKRKLEIAERKEKERQPKETKTCEGCGASVPATEFNTETKLCHQCYDIVSN